MRRNAAPLAASMELDLLVFVLTVLAVWRVTHLLVAETGPADVLVRFRRAAASLRLGRLVNCFYCASIWVAIPFALFVGPTWRAVALCIPALSAGAILLERATLAGAPAAWAEEEDAT